ncbi:SagB/ThcOx family dehydrogenase [Natronorubrum aibiense]|uniref:SagB/ThcOx family dehydrogenase n=1 Tax=Natronorubrum aibiense TaxID=348826 RepID=A0A5P9P4M9_9EURY|nr:SagB/ThcOx family dehydrogenase [Natronorubrum aibiense]QFU83105.1 SagB/ThcOx family dehydrogenase [Natronorubrum aibiense]
MAPIDLPDPGTHGSTSVERAIATRASRRSFARTPLELADVAQLLWAAQGLTHVRDGVEMRTAPSAGATYPLVAFLEVAPDGCAALEAGLYRYDPRKHRLEFEREGPIHDDLTEAALGQDVVRAAPATVVLAADADRTRRQYPDHGDRYVHMEAGHAAQNVLLVCASRELHGCPVGAFDDADLSAALGLPERLEALYLLPCGRPPADR